MKSIPIATSSGFAWRHLTNKVFSLNYHPNSFLKNPFNYSKINQNNVINTRINPIFSLNSSFSTIPSSSNNSDCIHLNGCIFYGYHGYYSAEQELGQKFIVDAVVYLDLKPAGNTGELEKTIDYVQIWNILNENMTKKKFTLLEQLSHTISKDIIKKYPNVNTVNLTIKKPHVALQGVVNYLGINTIRSREDFES